MWGNILAHIGVHHTNYWTPLTSQVKALDPPPHPPESLLLACQWGRHMGFDLPTGHTNKDSTNYRQRKYPDKDDNTRHVKTTLHDVRQGVLNSSIPLALSDTAATSNAILPSAPMSPTSTVSTAVFHLPNRATAAATMIHKLHHNLREPARSVNVNPQFGTNSFLEWGLPDLEFFGRLPITEQGLPVSEWGLYFILFFESCTTRSQKRSVSPISEQGCQLLPVLKL
jgi:hypothetical protein